MCEEIIKIIRAQRTHSHVQYVLLENYCDYTFKIHFILQLVFIFSLSSWEFPNLTSHCISAALNLILWLSSSAHNFRKTSSTTQYTQHVSLPVLGLTQNGFTFSLQSNCVRILLEPYWDHLMEMVSDRLFNTHSRLIAVLSPTHTNCTKEENTAGFYLNGLNIAPMGIFSPIAHLLWVESVDKFVNFYNF